MSLGSLQRTVPWCRDPLWLHLQPGRGSFPQLAFPGTAHSLLSGLSSSHSCSGHSRLLARTPPSGLTRVGSPHCPPDLDRSLGVPLSAPLDRGACPQAVSPTVLALGALRGKEAEVPLSARTVPPELGGIRRPSGELPTVPPSAGAFWQALGRSQS